MNRPYGFSAHGLWSVSKQGDTMETTPPPVIASDSEAISAGAYRDCFVATLLAMTGVGTLFCA